MNTQIPACLWFLKRNKEKRKNEILFIDARNLGYLINRRTRELSKDDINLIAKTYSLWKKETPQEKENISLEEWQKSLVAESSISYNISYSDVPGFCNSAHIDRVKELDYVLTPGRYVGLPEEEDDFNFEERFNSLRAELEAQIKEEEKLNKTIFENLKRVKK